MVRCTFSPARAWRPTVVARLAQTLGVKANPMQTTRASASRIESGICAALRVGTELDEKTSTRANRKLHEARSPRWHRSLVSQWVQPRPGQGSASSAWQRAAGKVNTRQSPGRARQRLEAVAPSAPTCRLVPSNLTPNPSFELTRYGRPPCLGGIRFANCVPPSQAGLPQRSAQFKR